MMYDLPSLEEKFSKLRVDSSKDRYTVGKAPHKAVLLMSLMILDSDGRIDLRSFDPDLYLRDTWNYIWEEMDYLNPGNITQPLYHMKSEGFWSFDKNYDGKPPAFSKFKDSCGMIHIDDDVAKLMHENRDALIRALLNGGYFSEKEASRISGLIPELEDSFVFERKMELELKNEFSIIPMMHATKRNPAFRRMILSTYNETCAVCGMRITTASGAGVIDAAHILPFSRFHNDDCRNGLSLCKLHHWMFDRGLLSVNDHYRIILSKDIKDAPEEMMAFEKENIILPGDDQKYPAKIALMWHRKNVFIKN